MDTSLRTKAYPFFFLVLLLLSSRIGEAATGQMATWSKQGVGRRSTRRRRLCGPSDIQTDQRPGQAGGRHVSPGPAALFFINAQGHLACREKNTELRGK